MVTQYKSDPVQVVDFLKEQNNTIEQNSNVQSVPFISQSDLVAVKTEPTIEDSHKGAVVEVELLSSSDEAELTKRKIKAEPDEPVNSKLKRDSQDSSKGRSFKSESDENSNEMHASGKEYLITDSIKIIANSKPGNILDLSIKEEWLNLFYKTNDNIDNCRTVLASLDVFKHLKEYSKINNCQLLRVLMSLLLNIAEFKDLRKAFLRKEIIEIFHKLLTDSTDSIVYRALKLFVFLISEGASTWQSSGLIIVDRNKIIQDMDLIIEKWKSNKVKMMYTGSNLNSIIEMQSHNVDAVCQKWACWILSQAHFKPNEVQKEKAIKNLRQILANLQTDKSIKNFAKVALKRFETIKV